MNNSHKILIATGGTGGHIFPAYSLAKYFIKKKFSVKIVTDKRGLKFLKVEKDMNIKTITSATVFNKNFFLVIYSLFKIIIAFVESLFLLIKIKPKIVFGMGGYSSFPTCLASKVLNIPFFIYENNLCLGKTNKFLLPFATKMLVSYDELEGVKEKYFHKLISIGNIIREDILNYRVNRNELNKNNLSLLILGGSQAAKSFAQLLPNIFLECKKNSMNLEIFQQCQKSQIEDLKQKYNAMGIKNEIFNFSHDLKQYFSKIDLTITRSGSSMLSEFLNCNVPIIAIPLPNSADNHQLKNAKYFEKKGYGYLVEEHQISEKLFSLIKLIYKDRKLLSQIKSNQMKHSDKNVFEKIYKEIEKFLYA